MSFSRTSRDIRLEGSNTLIATCERTDGSDPTSSKLNLDDFLGNMDGSFQWGDGLFSRSSENVRLDGTILWASLRKINGQMRRAHIDLDQRIANVGGRLIYVSQAEKEVEDAVLSARALDSMWNSPALANADPEVLPASGHLKSTLSQLRITLLAKTQHKSVHVVEGSQLVEPTLALYCPIEGGEHVIDATVKELAKETNSEVQVIDMAQVAAGEWGVFGKLASGYRLYNNPLGKVKAGENTDGDDDRDQNRRAFESFWRKLVESNPPAPAATPADETTIDISKPPPRIIYIRDFGLLASRVSTWFPSLYNAIRARRTNGLGPKSPISNPTTVIFGVSPRLYSHQDWNEDATEERAKRLKKQKERWDNGKLVKDLPSFRPTVKITKKQLEEEAAKDGTDNQSNPKVEEKPPAEKIEPKTESASGAEDGGEKEEKEKDKENTPEPEADFEQELDGYFRSCIIAPAKRNTDLERASRENRRRELNELMLRMAVGVKGGELESGEAPVAAKKDKKKGESEEKDKNDDDELTTGWDQRLLELDALNGVVDHALAIAMLSNEGEQEQELVPVNWTQLQDAWRESKSSDEERKAWTKDDDSGEEKDEKLPVDEIVEKVKNADLDKYEKRLLGCIVDVAKLQTTFENVHLPTHVVDSVRSIVSLPLMFPDAFKSGILKQQAISGALLFGPPGTGKTLVVRALAKESGSRMLAIKPSDVADMWVGETEKLVSAVFKLARRLKPCVVFIDEIDSIMGSRMGNSAGGSSRWHTSMLTEFMQEMDGLTSSSVIVIGATNRPAAIDDAVLRRLPCRLLVDLPGVEAREKILKIMLRDDELGPDVSINELARKTDRFSGSDLKHLCVAAAMDALKETVKLPWLSKQDEPKDTTSTKSENLLKSKLAIKETAQPEKSSTKSDLSDNESSRPASNPNSESASSTSTGATTPDEDAEPIKPRILAARHFLRALMDVAPSSSETQGSLSELRKWNTQFGTGARDQPRSVGSLPYSYGGSKSSLSGSSGGSGGIPGVNALSNYSSTGLGSAGLGSGGLGSTGLGSNLYGSNGLGASGIGSAGLGSSGLGIPGLGSAGLGSSGLGSSGIGLPGLGPSGLGPAGLGSSGLGSNGLGPNGLNSLGSLGLGSSGLSSLSGVGSKGPGTPGVTTYTPPTYTSPGMGGPSAGYTPKLPTSSSSIPGYTPSAPGGGPSAPGF